MTHDRPGGMCRSMTQMFIPPQLPIPTSPTHDRPGGMGRSLMRRSTARRGTGFCSGENVSGDESAASNSSPATPGGIGSLVRLGRPPTAAATAGLELAAAGAGAPLSAAAAAAAAETDVAAADGAAETEETEETEADAAAVLPSGRSWLLMGGGGGGGGLTSITSSSWPSWTRLSLSCQHRETPGCGQCSTTPTAARTCTRTQSQIRTVGFIFQTTGASDSYTLHRFNQSRHSAM